MDMDYLKSSFREMETKALVRVLYFTKGAYTKEAIKAAIAELKRRGEYKKEILRPIAEERKKEISDIKKLIHKASNKPFSEGEIAFMLIGPAIIAVLQYFSSHYWNTAVFLFVMLSAYLV